MCRVQTLLEGTDTGVTLFFPPGTRNKARGFLSRWVVASLLERVKGVGKAQGGGGGVVDKEVV